jgi:hypothetical protein
VIVVALVLVALVALGVAALLRQLPDDGKEDTNP